MLKVIRYPSRNDIYKFVLSFRSKRYTCHETVTNIVKKLKRVIIETNWIYLTLTSFVLAQYFFWKNIKDNIII